MPAHCPVVSVEVVPDPHQECRIRRWSLCARAILKGSTTSKRKPGRQDLTAACLPFKMFTTTKRADCELDTDAQMSASSGETPMPDVADMVGEIEGGRYV
jgi:hypothetical protein